MEPRDYDEILLCKVLYFVRGTALLAEWSRWGHTTEQKMITVHGLPYVPTPLIPILWIVSFHSFYIIKLVFLLRFTNQNFLSSCMLHTHFIFFFLWAHILAECLLKQFCLSIYTHLITQEQLNGFSMNFIFGRFLKFVRTFQFWSKLDNNSRHITWKPTVRAFLCSGNCGKCSERDQGVPQSFTTV
jgi:hypothetical protein